MDKSQLYWSEMGIQKLPSTSPPNGTGAAPPPAYLYERIARFVCDLVERGALKPGMRAPSLRSVAGRFSVSLSTAVQAYRLLEDRGVIEARPKSGFFVSRAGRETLGLPNVSAPSAKPARVTVSSGVISLMQHASDDSLVPLGCAIPSADLLAAGRLDRFLARAARVKGTRYNIYTPAHGDPDLRQEICRRAARWGQALAPDDVLITCGCTEALSIALSAVTRRGDVVAIESPTYFGLLPVLENLDLQAVELPTDPQHGVSIEALEAVLKRGTVRACLLSSSFNNPLGCTVPEDRKRAIATLLDRHGVPLIEDDIYGDIHFGADRPSPFMAVAPQSDIIYCNSFSKTVAPGYRIGWLAAPRHMKKALEVKFAISLCGPALPQAALADFLSSGGYDGHLRRIRRVFAHNIARMRETIAQAFPDATRVSRPAGGFVLWLELPNGVDGRRLAEAALAEGICIAPGDAFTSGDRYRNCIRLSCGHDWDDRLERAVRRLGALTAEAAVC